MQIRPEEPDDFTAIAKVIYAAFLNHPHHAPGALPTEHKIVDALRANGVMTLGLVAEVDNKIVGHIAFSPVEINAAPSAWYGLGPVSVAPEQQGRGIGAALVRSGIEAMRARGAAGIVLLGEPAYYQRFGFAAHPGLTLPDVPPAYFMGLPLAGPWAEGVVSYHPSFYVS